jgi:crotonobetainyl-CoA:carnitine CoA-transferase CaiB-like acyl-CoA transferase
MALNREPDAVPMPQYPASNDYISGLHTLYGAVTALYHAQKTGQGQVVDISQYESHARVLMDNFVAYAESDWIKNPVGSMIDFIQPGGSYQCKDGKYVSLLAGSKSVFDRFLITMDLDPEYFVWQECGIGVDACKSAKGVELCATFSQWILERNAQEVVDIYSANSVPASLIHNSEDSFNHPHWKARDNFIKYEDQTLEKEITAFGITPKFSVTPGEVWRGAPKLGQDTDKILSELLGFSEEKIQQLKDKKII